MLPREFYCSQEVFQADLEKIWYRNWLFAGYENQIKTPGEYFTTQGSDFISNSKALVGTENVIIIRGDDNQVRAFHNVCRHRGARICGKEEGKTGNLMCPYHGWTYDKFEP